MFASVVSFCRMSPKRPARGSTEYILSIRVSGHTLILIAPPIKTNLYGRQGRCASGASRVICLIPTGTLKVHGRHDIQPSHLSTSTFGVNLETAWAADWRGLHLLFLASRSRSLNLHPRSFFRKTRQLTLTGRPHHPSRGISTVANSSCWLCCERNHARLGPSFLSCYCNSITFFLLRLAEPVKIGERLLPSGIGLDGDASGHRLFLPATIAFEAMSAG